MHTYVNRRNGLVLALTALALLLCATLAQAYIQGTTGVSVTPNHPVFNLRAKAGYISTADGSSVFFWGFADDDGNGREQYPGPTMIVNQNDVVTVNLINELPEPTSLVFPGHEVTATNGTPGLLTMEAPPDRVTVVSYTFTATNPGTYMYYSGSHTDLHVEMGLIGALIVRPAGYIDMDPLTYTAYGDARSAYDQEYLFLLSEMDPRIHDQMEFGQTAQVNTTEFLPVLWYINGRNGPDTMGMNCEVTLPTQPYNCMPRINPGQRLLLRFVGAGRDLHPFHTHGNNMDLIARDGRLLESSVGASKTVESGLVPDLAGSDFTQTVMPGATYDSIFIWTGRGLGWDIYGHTVADPDLTDVDGDGFDDTTHEYVADHRAPFPVTLPSTSEIALGATYSGSPFLGAAGFLPPGEGGNNANAGYFFMWHSHNEKEMVNYDIFPGGLMTMMIVEPPGIVIPTMSMGACQ